MYGTRITLKTICGKHVVKHNGEAHIFETLHEALDYITIVHFINFRLGRKTI